MAELSDRDRAFVELFRWARETFSSRLKRGLPSNAQSGLMMVRLLSVEGVLQDLKVDEVTPGVPRTKQDLTPFPNKHYAALRSFHKLTRVNRERKADRLLEYWK